MYSGLRDAWLYTGNEDARSIFLKFCDWAIAVTSAITDEQMQSLLDIEHGGMNEIFADVYHMQIHRCRKPPAFNELVNLQTMRSI